MPDPTFVEYHATSIMQPAEGAVDAAKDGTPFFFLMCNFTESMKTFNKDYYFSLRSTHSRETYLLSWEFLVLPPLS